MKSDAPEKARITEDESAFRLVQDKVIVLLRPKIGRFDPQFPGHPEMKANPIAA